MRKCIRCNEIMVEDLDIKVEGGAYGLKVTKQGIFKANLGKSNVQFVQNVVIVKFILKILPKSKT